MTTATATGQRVHRVLAGFDHAISEFPDTPADKLPAIRVACWVAAWMPIAHSFYGSPLTPQELVRVYDDMVAHKDMDSSGTTMSAGDDYLRRFVKVQTLYPATWHWHPGTELADIHKGLIEQAGINGLILQVNKAGNLPHNEAHVGSHYIGVGGIDSVEGYWTVNGDDMLALAGNHGHGTTYAPRWMSWADLVAAEPTALLAILHPTQPSAVAIPQGWRDSGDTLWAPNGIAVVKGFRAYILAHGSAWNSDDWPLALEQGDANGTFQPFKSTLLQWTPADGVTTAKAGPLQAAFLTLSAQPKYNPSAQAALNLLRAFRTGLESIA